MANLMVSWRARCHTIFTSSNWSAHPSILANGLTGMLLSKLCALDPLNNSKRKTISGILHKCQMRSCAIFAHLIYYPASFAEIWSGICDYKNIIVICQTAFVVVPNLGSLLLYNIHSCIYLLLELEIRICYNRLCWLFQITNFEI